MSNQFSPWPSFSEEEADIVKNILLSNKVNYWTGTECRDFENEFANWSDSKYAVALSIGPLLSFEVSPLSFLSFFPPFLFLG